MKFEFEKDKDRGEVVAVYGKMSDGVGHYLAIKTSDPHKTIWMYDGPLSGNNIQVQGVFLPSDPIKKFYRGDKITITF